MPFTVVLDTCVLYPANLRDTLLRLAERGLFQPLWSEDILEELQRNLVKKFPAESIDRLLEAMESAFTESKVTGYESIIDSLTCDPKDRHVLAAAVRADASAIITFNQKDFPLPSLEPFQIETINPDDFLLDQLDLAPHAVLDELQQQAAANRRHPKTLQDLLDALAKAGAPKFADRIRRL